MNTLIAMTSLLAILALAEGSIVISAPGLSGPTIHRGLN